MSRSASSYAHQAQTAVYGGDNGEVPDDEDYTPEMLRTELRRAAVDTRQRMQEEQIRSACIPLEVKEQMLKEAFPPICDDVEWRVPTLTKAEMEMLRRSLQTSERKQSVAMIKSLWGQMQEYHELLDSHGRLKYDFQKMKSACGRMAAGCVEKTTKIADLERQVVEMKLSLAQVKSGEDHHWLAMARMESELDRVAKENLALHEFVIRRDSHSQNSVHFAPVKLEKNCPKARSKSLPVSLLSAEESHKVWNVRSGEADALLVRTRAWMKDCCNGNSTGDSLQSASLPTAVAQVAALPTSIATDSAPAGGEGSLSSLSWQPRKYAKMSATPWRWSMKATPPTNFLRSKSLLIPKTSREGNIDDNLQFKSVRPRANSFASTDDLSEMLASVGDEHEDEERPPCPLHRRHKQAAPIYSDDWVAGEDTDDDILMDDVVKVPNEHQKTKRRSPASTTRQCLPQQLISKSSLLPTLNSEGTVDSRGGTTLAGSNDSLLISPFSHWGEVYGNNNRTGVDQGSSNINA